jgi:hypothetical protein
VDAGGGNVLFVAKAATSLPKASDAAEWPGIWPWDCCRRECLPPERRSPEPRAVNGGAIKTNKAKRMAAGMTM